MVRVRRLPARRWLTVILGCSVGLIASRAVGQGFAGQISYSGNLGPVSAKRPLCLCLYTDAGLTSEFGCLKFVTNPAQYNLEDLGRGPFYLEGFVDIHVNAAHDPDEPYEIYNDRAAPPGDPVAADGNKHVDLAFGDENLPGAPTATPTSTPTPSSPPDSPTPTATPPPVPSNTRATPTAPPTSGVVPGDCDGNGLVTVDELMRAIAIALDTMAAKACPAADVNHDGMVGTDELVRAVNAALGH